MANISIDNFDSYTNGSSLNTQGGWSGVNTNVLVTTAQSNTAPNSINWSQAGGGTNGKNKSITPLVVDSDQIVFYIRSTVVNNAGGGSCGFSLFSGANNLFTARLSVDNNATQLLGATTVNGNVPVANTWYQITVEFDFTNHRARMKIDAGAFTAYVSATGSVAFTNIDGIGIVVGGAGATGCIMYMDSLQANFTPLVTTTPDARLFFI